MKTVTAAEANRRFSSVLREAARGETITVLSRGRPVATIGPAQADRSSRKSAKAALLKRLRTQVVTGRRAWTREELYRR